MQLRNHNTFAVLELQDPQKHLEYLFILGIKFNHLISYRRRIHSSRIIFLRRFIWTIFIGFFWTFVLLVFLWCLKLSLIQLLSVLIQFLFLFKILKILLWLGTDFHWFIFLQIEIKHITIISLLFQSTLCFSLGKNRFRLFLNDSLLDFRLDRTIFDLLFDCFLLVFLLIFNTYKCLKQGVIKVYSLFLTDIETIPSFSIVPCWSSKIYIELKFKVKSKE